MKIYRNLSLLLILVLLLEAMPYCNASQTDIQSKEHKQLGVPTARQIELIRAVLTVGGKLTPQMHSEFWADYKDLSKADSELLAADIKKTAPALVQYQKALWQSARLSLEASKVIRSKDLDAAWLELERVSPDENGTAAASAKSFLEAVASGKPLKKENDEIIITSKLIDQVIAGIDESLERLTNLVNPNWSPISEL